MTPDVKKAVEFLTATYQDVAAAASVWTLNPQEVQDALKESTPDTAEHYVLTLLAKSNPANDIPKAKQKAVEVKDVVAETKVVND